MIFCFVFVREFGTFLMTGACVWASARFHVHYVFTSVSMTWLKTPVSVKLSVYLLILCTASSGKSHEGGIGYQAFYQRKFSSVDFLYHSTPMSLLANRVLFRKQTAMLSIKACKNFVIATDVVVFHAKYNAEAVVIHTRYNAFIKQHRGNMNLRFA